MKLSPERESLPRTLALVYLLVALLSVLLLNLTGHLVARLATCPLRYLTGLACPTCGGTHAALALAQGNLGEAFRQNPLVALAALGLAIWATYAVVATAVPRWRRQIDLTAREQTALRAGVVLLFLLGWLYEIVRLG